MGDDPGPARSLPAEPAPELPTPRWGVDLNEAEREVRSVIRAAPFGRKRPTPAARLGETVPLPRPLVRLGLFSREDNPPPTAGTHLTLPGGELHISGARPSWRDLRVVLILTALAKQESGRLTETYLPPTRLAAYTSKSKNTRNIEHARASLDRLCETKVAFALKGFGEVGTSQRPEHIIVRDPHDEDLYVLRPWLARLLERGFDREQKTAYIEQHVSWPVMCALWRAPLLLYAYLEAENWPAEGWHRDPASPHAEPVHTRELLLEDPLMSVLDLHELSPEAKRLEAVKRAMRLIRGRDWRYRSFKLYRYGPRRIPVLRVWRAPGKPVGSLIWTGAVCERCKRPDPHRACCCDRPPGQRCSQPQCPRCSERR